MPSFSTGSRAESVDLGSRPAALNPTACSSSAALPIWLELYPDPTSALKLSEQRSQRFDCKRKQCRAHSASKQKKDQRVAQCIST